MALFGASSHLVLVGGSLLMPGLFVGALVVLMIPCDTARAAVLVPSDLSGFPFGFGTVVLLATRCLLCFRKLFL